MIFRINYKLLFLFFLFPSSGANLPCFAADWLLFPSSGANSGVFAADWLLFPSSGVILPCFAADWGRMRQMAQ